MANLMDRAFLGADLSEQISFLNNMYTIFIRVYVYDVPNHVHVITQPLQSTSTPTSRQRGFSHWDTADFSQYIFKSIPKKSEIKNSKKLNEVKL